MNNPPIIRRFPFMQFLTLLPLLIATSTAEPEVIDDVALRSGFQMQLGELAETGRYPTVKELSEKAAEAPASWRPEEAGLATDSPGNVDDAVFLIGGVYKCGKCDDWHLSSVATAWALSRDGLMVTNQHVFKNKRGEVMGVGDRHGKVYPITEVLAAHEGDDTALFRVEADSLVPLPLGPAPAVGAEVEVISHPQNRFFMHTYGRVARHFVLRRPHDQPSSTRMAITADYAKGSSGGPVLDSEGRVVGMVSSTQSIYYESKDGSPKGPLQMVLKNCVTLSAIEALLGR